ncbi:M20 family metallopeptidase [Eubacterium callanderi]|uniref:M20 family metallopeptidase n=1 Tax=Eubacterium callanderi TaxID=53442 RepID=UPI001AA1086F|nr:M20/M25/M40 family metallo-hydrolase [Eubacterium callanderi]MBO1703097.1 M20/M25/M40 family metallo-hydrolase [Eubacterium callanderi]MDR4073318.1 M20/M25/M40 family metallo-hydrolase [Eubacterium sp.]
MSDDCKMQKEYVAFLKALIEIPSLSGEEGEAAVFIQNALDQIGVTPKVDEAGNVYGVINCGEGPVVLLNGHLDVVPEGSLEAWKPYSPFKAAVESDVLIGRGASDLKAGLAAQFFAFKRIKQALDTGASLKGKVIFSAVVHEEAAEMLGMQYLIDHTLEGEKIDLCVLCEPSSGRVALGHRGKVELVVKTMGKTAHSSQPKQGINALEKMLPVMQYIFKEMPKTLKGHPVLGDNSVTITDCIVWPGAQSIIPDECEISIDRRYSPDETLEDVVCQLKAVLDDFAEKDPEFKAEVHPRTYCEKTYTGYTCEVNKYHPPWATDQQIPVVKKALDALENAGQKPECFYWKFGTDGGYTAGLRGIPTIGYSHAEEKWAHQPKEQVKISQMMKTIEGTEAILAAILDLKEK